MNASELLLEILRVSKKAALIAKTIRTDSTLFSLLIEEKSSIEKNCSFVKDFKTLADVVIQEVIKYDLNEKFPGIANRIQGEESNKFVNTLGESITFEVKSCQANTSELLERVLNGHKTVADTIASIVHSHVDINDVEMDCSKFPNIDVNDIGIWIDPLDSTTQYVHGSGKAIQGNSLMSHSLESVLVLVGAFVISSGLPVLGVIYQPFSVLNEESKQWTGRHIWGISYGEFKLNNLIHHNSTSVNSSQRIAVSKAEHQELISKLQKNFEVVTCSGAGYKLLCIIDQKALLYVLQLPSSYKWDVCAPHAILSSTSEGGIVNLQKAVKMWAKGNESIENVICSCQTCYKLGEKKAEACNAEGIVGFATRQALGQFLNIMLSDGCKPE